MATMNNQGYYHPYDDWLHAAMHHLIIILTAIGLLMTLITGVMLVALGGEPWLFIGVFAGTVGCGALSYIIHPTWGLVS